MSYLDIVERTILVQFGFLLCMSVLWFAKVDVYSCKVDSVELVRLPGNDYTWNVSLTANYTVYGVDVAVYDLTMTNKNFERMAGDVFYCSLLRKTNDFVMVDNEKSPGFTINNPPDISNSLLFFGVFLAFLLWYLLLFALSLSSEKTKLQDKPRITPVPSNLFEGLPHLEEDDVDKKKE